LEHLDVSSIFFDHNRLIKNTRGAYSTTIEHQEEKYHVRLLTWVSGRLWIHVQPKTTALRFELGKIAGACTQALSNFDHPQAHRSFDWNIADSPWTIKHIALFTSEEQEITSYFQKRFTAMQAQYAQLPKSVIHNDVNDHNILVSENLKDPNVTGLIDFGDAVYSQTINDVAIVLAYAMMDVPDPLGAAVDVLKGYAKLYTFYEEELSCLYTLIAMRLITTVTKAALRKQEEGATSYHAVSEQPAWNLLKRWHEVSAEFAEYTFRNTCGYSGHPKENAFKNWSASQKFRFEEMFPTASPTLAAKTVKEKSDCYLLDLKLSSSWIGSKHEFNDLELFEFKINRLQKEHPTKFIADGYLEPRPIYTSTAYDKEGNSGPESRAVHLGVDFWLPAHTAIHALFDAEVVTAVNDKGYKEYGGLIILKHSEDTIPFYSLYGHLTAESPSKFQLGDTLKKGDLIGHLGSPEENGEWSPHLHFQIMLTMLDYKIDFPGVTYPKQIPVWKSLCPDPNLLFKQKNLVTQYDEDVDNILSFRKEHLGKGMSVSYNEPLHIVRGDGAYLIDSWGRKYLDTVNNVAHVGHEHPRVVEAAQKQIGLLNTNTRYVHTAINAYAEVLLEKLPKELSVLHFVNSGSEANELAIRMAKTVTGHEHMVAIEVGYHGNTNAVIDVSSYKFDGAGGKGIPENTSILPLPDPFRGKHQGENSGETYANYLDEILEDLESKGKKVAAFIGEPIISCGGQIVPPKNYFKNIYQKVRKAGGVCIADEVQTGFGRIGSSFWAFQLHGVTPDIVTMGKPAGNGHPLAVVACTPEIADAFNNGMEYFNTFGGNPVSSRIGKTVLDVIETEQLQKQALKVGSYLKDKLRALQQDFPIIGDVRGEGLFLGFELVDENMQPLAEHADYLANRMKELKILMSTDGPDHNVLKIKPPMVFSIENAKELIFRLRYVFAEDFMQVY